MEKRTKIVATLGPSSEDPKILEEMIKFGMNVARINFSHGTHESNGKIIDIIKGISEKLKIPVGIMADLQGPRIRTLVDEDLNIEKGEIIGVYDISQDSAKVKNQNAKLQLKIQKFIGLDVPGIINNIAEGNEILIEDGLIKIKVTKKEDAYLEAEVIDGGIIKNHKGVNIPDAKLEIGAVTQKDEEDLKFALGKDVDFVALSFVSNAGEIENAREKIKKILGRADSLPQIVSKIERKEAIKNIDEIIKASDVIMVARGDLGIEIEESKVVIYQKELVGDCLRDGKPVIVATQMLNSMIENPRPTRAEVSDVSNAVIDHADAVMLSGETADGKYPVETIKIMSEIIERTEESPFDDLEHGFLSDKTSSVSAAVSQSAHELAKDSGAKAIVVASVSGFAARMIARHRPQQDIFVMTNNVKTHNQLTLLWGTISFMLPNCQNLEDLIDKSIETITENKLVKEKDKVVIVAGRPGSSQEHMSLVKVEEIK